MNTNDESYVCDFDQPLASRSAKREFAGGNLWHPTVQAGVGAPGGNCSLGIASVSILIHWQASVGMQGLQIRVSRTPEWNVLMLQRR